MRDHFDFNQPINREEDNTYITVAQMKFFLNRDFGLEKFKCRDEEFVEYYNVCRVYNLVSDLMEKNEDAAIMYWDEKKEVVSMGFPTDGMVAKALSGIEPSLSLDDDPFDEDDYEHLGPYNG